MRSLLILAALLSLPCTAAHAQQSDPLQRFSPTQDVGIDQRLGERVPLDLVFRDEHGEAVKLAQYFGKKPVVLALVYYECSMLCTLVLNDMVRAMKVLPLELGDDYAVITVSIDPHETPELAARKKLGYLGQLARRGANPSAWHFLTGDDETIHELAKAVGFRYVYDADVKQYAHAAGLIVVTPEGVLSRYFLGLEYSALDLRLALVEASHGDVGGLTEQVLLLCFHYDETSGKYGFAIWSSLRAAAIATVGGVALFLFVSLRREARARASAEIQG